MHLFIANALLAMGPAPQSNQPPPPFWVTLVPFVFIGIIFYVLLLRPQQKKNKELTEMLKSVRKGDRILTTGGILATVITVKEKTLTVRSEDSKFEVTKSAVAEITERSGESTPS
jgi:preprotein translocase subunit YajC